MSKKTLLALAMATMASTAGFASNFYIGGELGISFLESIHRFKSTSTTSFSEKHHLGGFGLMGGGFAGYNFDFCRQYDFGVEAFIFGNTTELSRRSDFDDNRFNLYSNYNYGVRILPGFYIMGDCVETHLILGYTRANFSLCDRRVIAEEESRFRRNFDRDGYQVGGGLRLDFCNNISLRFDGVFSGYPSECHRFLDTDEVTSVEYRHDTQFYTFDGTFSVIYNF